MSVGKIRLDGDRPLEMKSGSSEIAVFAKQSAQQIMCVNIVGGDLQGALAIECRADRAGLIAALQPLEDRPTTLATTAERAFSRALAGNCNTPIAAHAVERTGELWLRGFLASRDGSEILRGSKAAVVENQEQADTLGRSLADDFRARGAARLSGD